MQRRFLVILLGLGLVCSGVAQGALIDRGSGLIYDTSLNVTWLADASLAQTESFGVSQISPNNSQVGDMSWYTALTWLAEMNSAKYLGYNNWRLPRMTPINGMAFNTNFSTDGTTDIGYNITSVNSELAHLANVDLRGLDYFCSANSPRTGPSCAQMDIGFFKNIQFNFTYQSETELVPGSDDYLTLGFNSPVSVGGVTFSWGHQGVAGKRYTGVVMVLLDGDVVSTSNLVPEPGTVLLTLMGLGLLGSVFRPKKMPYS